MALDQRGFQMEGVLLGVSGDDFELRDASGEDSGFAFERARRTEIAADAGPEIGGFADVDHTVVGVAEGVDAGLCGQRGDLRLELGAGLFGGGRGRFGGHGFSLAKRPWGLRVSSFGVAPMYRFAV